MALTANGQRILEATIREPLEGRWVADLDLDSDEALAGSVELDIDGVAFRGAVLGARAGVDSGRSKARIVGGAGGLDRVLDARFYTAPHLALVISQILADAGETLSAESDDLALEFRPRFHRLRDAASHLLTAATEEAGKTWRVQRDGTIRVAAETFPTLEVEATELDYDPRTDSKLIAPAEGPEARPGVTIGSRKVARVVTTIGPGGTRQQLYFESDRLRATLKKIVRSAQGSAIDLGAHYPCTVITQRADLTLDLMPDDERIGAGKDGLSGIPIRHGLPGVDVEVPAGARICLAFEAADPTRPYAVGWTASTLTSITVTATTKIKLVAPAVDVADALAAVLRNGEKVNIAGVQAGAGVSGVIITVDPTTFPPFGPSDLKG